MRDIPLFWNQTGKEASDEDELRTEENRFLVQCNKKRADTGKRKASITREADRKEMYFYLAVPHGKPKQHMSLQCVFLEKQHERKIKLFRSA
jgi:hypothetical protein